MDGSAVVSVVFIVLCCREVSTNLQYIDENLYDGSPCRMYSGKKGSCSVNCQIDPRSVRRSDICGFYKKEPIICCDNDHIVSPEAKSAAYLLRQYPTLFTTCIRHNPSERVAIEHTTYEHVTALGWTDRDGTIAWKCGGSLIHPKFVLSTAHCIDYYGTAPDIARLGDINNSPRTADYDVERIIAHPNYRSSEGYYDISIIKVTSRGSNITPIPVCLYAQKEFPTITMTTMGYGPTDETRQYYKLFKEALSVIETRECRPFYTHDDFLPNGVVDNQICAYDPTGSLEICQAGSGSPLHYTRNDRSYVVGMISFVRQCTSQVRIVHTRIYPYLGWIEGTINQHNY